MNILLELLPAILGLIGQFLVAFLQNWNTAHGTDPNIAAVIYSYVQSAQANSELKTPDERYQWVFDRMKEWALMEGKAIKDSMLNTLIELAVLRLKQASVATP